MLGACSGGSDSSPTDPGDPGGSGPSSLVFRASPIALDAIRYITPLGTMNPPGHTLPTDHIYFFFADPSAGESPVARRTAFFAPGDGTVIAVIDNGLGSDRKVTFRATRTVVYYIDHLIPTAALTPGTKVTAGQRLGTTGSAFAVDLGVVNDDLVLPGIVNPSRYPDVVHTDAPLKYYEEPLRSQLYAKVQGLGPNLDGKIDFDIAGRLSGNWFGVTDQAPIAFAYDTYDPTLVRIGIASGLSLSGVFGIATTDVAPRDVSVASGMMTYTLTRAQTGPPITGAPVGHMLVRMLDDQRLQVETFTPVTAPSTSFTGNAKVFIR